MRFLLGVGLLVLVCLAVEAQRFNQRRQFNNFRPQQNFQGNRNVRQFNNNNNFRPQQQNFRPQQQQQFRPQQNNFRPQPQNNFRPAPQRPAPAPAPQASSGGRNGFSLVLDTSDGRFAPFNGPVKGIPAGHGGGRFGQTDCLTPNPTNCPTGKK